MELEHFSHKHKLIFNNDQEIGGEKVSCFGCKELLFAPTYSCKQCNFFLHKACAELPRQIRLPSHRKHSLTLQENSSHNNLSCICNSCDGVCGNFIYSCSLCNFNLDTKCAMIPCIFEPKDQKHRLITLAESIPYICDACGNDGEIDSCAYLCTMCQLIVHSDCRVMSLPSTMEVIQHAHPLIHSFFLQENHESEQQYYCTFCHREIDPDDGCYNCSECNFVSHVNCAFDYGDCQSMVMSGEDIEHEEIDETEVNMIPEMNMIMEINLDDHDKHFSHKHPLIFNQERPYEDEQNSCSVCEEQVLGPNYSCRQCAFFLHRKCAELPGKIKHPFHWKHPLILLEKSSRYASWQYSFCHFCRTCCPKFGYRCLDCEFDLHIKCASPPCIIKPQDHQHQFIRLMRLMSFTCNACGNKGEGDESPYFCTMCQVKVHKSCISLPQRIKVIGDDHLLSHSYFLHENESAGLRSCGICDSDVK